jgi:hypothetical protein
MMVCKEFFIKLYLTAIEEGWKISKEVLDEFLQQSLPEGYTTNVLTREPPSNSIAWHSFFYYTFGSYSF